MLRESPHNKSTKFAIFSGVTAFIRKFSSQKNSSQKTAFVRKFSGQKQLLLENFLVRNSFCQKIFWLETAFVRKFSSQKQLLLEKFKDAQNVELQAKNIKLTTNKYNQAMKSQVRDVSGWVIVDLGRKNKLKNSLGQAKQRTSLKVTIFSDRATQLRSGPIHL